MKDDNRELAYYDDAIKRIDRCDRSIIIFGFVMSLVSACITLFM